jgi:hypothetical protein
MKTKPSGTSFDEAEDLSSIGDDILGSIENSILDRVSLRSTKRLQSCIDASGECPE